MTFIVVDRRDPCPHCDRVKDFLTEKGIDYTTVTIAPEHIGITSALGWRMVPQVIWPDGWVGGADETINRYHDTADRAAQQAILGSLMPMLKYKKLSERAEAPKRGTPGSAGLDLAYAGEHDVSLQPNMPMKLSTGLAFEVPHGFYLRVAPRSGLGVKGIHVLAGVVDEDYRGEVHVVLINLSSITQVVKPGDRIAQALFERITLPRLFEVNTLSETVRGAGGYGSTGR